MKAINQIKFGGIRFLAKLLFCAIQDFKDVNENLSPIKLLMILRARILITLAEHEKVRFIATQLLNSGSNTGHYILAISDTLTGKIQNAENCLRNLTVSHPAHKEAHYLLAEILNRNGNQAEAIKIMRSLTKKTKNLKPWIVWSNSLKDKFHFDEYREELDYAESCCKVNGSQATRIKCLANAALRAKQYQELPKIFGRYNSKNKPLSLKQRINFWANDYFSIDFGKQALEHIDIVLKQNSVEYFLISGTLLGCIRENSLLPHDRDLDIGVWLDDGIERVKNLLLTSGYFHFVETRSAELLKLKHVTGVAIDVFFHKKNKATITHAGVKTVWHNALFDLKDHEFLGKTFLTPANYDQYLTENYGDWRTPKIEFDCALDTPNATIYNQAEMDVYAQIKILMGHRRSEEYARLISEEFQIELTQHLQAKRQPK